MNMKELPFAEEKREDGWTALSLHAARGWPRKRAGAIDLRLRPPE